MKVFLTFVSILFVGIFLYYFFNISSPKPKETPLEVKVQDEPAVDLSKVKTFEKLKLDITSEENRPVAKDRTYFFENEKKEVFSYYSLSSAWAVAKFDGQKWVFLQGWNGNPDCLVFDNAGVPYYKSTIEFACQIDGYLRADSNPKDAKAYEEYWSK